VTYRKAICDVQRAYANPALPRLDHRVSIRQPRRCGDLGEKQKGSDNPNSPLFLRAGTRGSLQGEKIARSALNGEQAPGREPQRGIMARGVETWQPKKCPRWAVSTFRIVYVFNATSLEASIYHTAFARIAANLAASTRRTASAPSASITAGIMGRIADALTVEESADGRGREEEICQR
jgi:hypothetical protein